MPLETNARQVSVYDPATDEWQEWRLPGDNPQAYSVYVDELDKVVEELKQKEKADGRKKRE
jgi:streptogramin lyase